MPPTTEIHLGTSHPRARGCLAAPPARLPPPTISATRLR